jgi:hypothetical protein
MNIEPNQNQDDAQEMLAAMREIQDSPELQAEAAKNPESVLDRLKLSGVARHAVALGIAGVTVAAHTQQHAHPLTSGMW